MNWIIGFLAAYIFILGCCIGSFMNVCQYRVPKGISVVKGRSFCPVCHRTLSFLELAPLASFLLQRGRCKGCGCRISWRYPLVEAAVGGLFLLAAWRFGLSVKSVGLALFFCLLLSASLFDLDTGEIPDGVSLFILAIVPLYSFLFPTLSWQSHLLGALCLSVPLFIGALFGGFGGGDVKLCFASGLFLGAPLTLLGGMLGVIAGGIYAAWLLITNRAKRGDAMAFGPFLAAGLTLAALFGEQLLSWYRRFL